MEADAVVSGLLVLSADRICFVRTETECRPTRHLHKRKVDCTEVSARQYRSYICQLLLEHAVYIVFYVVHVSMPKGR